MSGEKGDVKKENAVDISNRVMLFLLRYTVQNFCSHAGPTWWRNTAGQQ